jgi:hypothetical protein
MESNKERRGLLREIDPGICSSRVYSRAARTASAAAAKRVLPATLMLEAAPGNCSRGGLVELVELAGGVPGTEELAGGA